MREALATVGLATVALLASAVALTIVVMCCPLALRANVDFSFVIANAQKPVIIKKYPDRRLYNTATHTFMTLDDLADLVRQGIELAIHKTKSGKDITRSVLLHIILERERKETQNLLPTAFLRQLIRFYGHSMQMIVPVFLDVSLSSFIREQEKLRHQAISASSQETEM